MSKIKEIKQFFSGIISSFSSSDINEDAASFSTNIDSVTKDGVLKGIPEHRLVATFEVDSAMSVAVEDKKGQFDLVYVDRENGQVKLIKDMYGTGTFTIPENSSAVGQVPVDMELHNRNVYIGNGTNL